jgi:hypothetical protein
VDVGYPGVGTKVSRSQRAEVLRLRHEGWSIRRIAAEVFGSARYRGRVERALARSGLDPESEVSAGSGLEGLAPVEAIRVLYERRLAMLIAGDGAPSMAELQKLLDVQRQLDAVAQYERLRNRRRERK